MKILHVLDYSVPEVSGYASRSSYIINFQKDLGLEPIVVTSSRQKQQFQAVENIDGITYYRTILPQGVIINFIKKLPGLKALYEMYLLRKRISFIVKKIKIDVIHAHSPVIWGLAAFSIAKKMNIPFVYEIRALWEDAAVDQNKTTTNSLRYKVTKMLETYLCRHAQRVVTICDGLREEIEHRGVSQEKIFVVPNGVDSNKFVTIPKDDQLVKLLNIQNKTVIGFIGSLYKFEGVENLIRAYSLILRDRKDVMLVIVGSGFEIDNLKRLVLEMNLEQDVLLLGRVPHADILKFYSIIDILVYPRIRLRITEMVTPIKPLEAMSMGKCVLASDVGGLKELITNNYSGILFNAEDVSDLVAKCSSLLESPILRNTLGEQARIEMVEKRDWGKILSSYPNFYYKLSERII